MAGGMSVRVEYSNQHCLIYNERTRVLASLRGGAITIEHRDIAHKELEHSAGPLIGPGHEWLPLLSGQESRETVFTARTVENEVERGVELASEEVGRDWQLVRRITMFDFRAPTLETVLNIKDSVINRSGTAQEAAPGGLFPLPLPAQVRFFNIGLPRFFAGHLPADESRFFDESAVLYFHGNGQSVEAGLNFLPGKETEKVEVTFPGQNTFLDFQFTSPRGPFPRGCQVELFGDQGFCGLKFLGRLQALAPGETSELSSVNCAIREPRG
jgi:hypothetical protein